MKSWYLPAIAVIAILLVSLPLALRGVRTRQEVRREAAPGTAFSVSFDAGSVQNTTNIAPGDPLTAYVFMDPSGETISGFQFRLEFPTELQVTNIVPASSIFDPQNVLAQNSGSGFAYLAVGCDAPCNQFYSGAQTLVATIYLNTDSASSGSQADLTFNSDPAYTAIYDDTPNPPQNVLSLLNSGTVSFSGQPSPTVPPSGDVCTNIEAESGAYTSEWQVGTEGSRTYIQANSYGGTSTYDVEIPTTGNYQISGMVYGATYSQGAVRINFENQTAKVWRFGVYGSWVNSTSDEVFSLSAGSHQLILSTYYNGARVDWLRVEPVTGCGPTPTGGLTPTPTTPPGTPTPTPTTPPGTPTPTPTIGGPTPTPQPGAHATLYVEPASQVVYGGDNASVQVVMNPDGHNVSGVNFRLTFDNQRLYNPQVSMGSVFVDQEEYQGPIIGSNYVEIPVSRRPGTSTYTGSPAVLATISFTTYTSASGTAQLTFDPSITEIYDDQTVMVLESTTGGQIIISPCDPRVRFIDTEYTNGSTTPVGKDGNIDFFEANLYINNYQCSFSGGACDYRIPNTADGAVYGVPNGMIDFAEVMLAINNYNCLYQ